MANSGIIDSSGKGFRLTTQTVSALLLIAAISGLWYFPLHYVFMNQVAHPAVSMLLPIIGISWLALVIPLFMLLSFPEDYKRLNPLNPVHYIYIAQKGYRAMSQNNYKVSVKDM